MKSLYLILAATAVVVISEGQRTDNDLIWYPVDDDDETVISLFGEKHVKPVIVKGRSHRRARYSGMEPPIPHVGYHDPTENRDPSFFHNIHDRRPLLEYPTVPKIPPTFLTQHVPHKRPHKWPQGSQRPQRPQGPQGPPGPQGSQRPQEPQGPPGQEKPYENIQEIFNEIFSRPSENPGGTTGQWGTRPSNQNQLVGSMNGNNNNIQRPGNQWESTSESVVQRPSNQWGGSRPVQKPTNSEWIGTTKPITRPTSQSDKLIFPDDDSVSKPTRQVTTTTPELFPTDRPTLSPCEMQCPATPEFNPVCGTDGVTYTNAGRLKCTNMCGKNVSLSHYGNCGRTPFSTPLVSSGRKQKLEKFRGFWAIDH